MLNGDHVQGLLFTVCAASGCVGQSALIPLLQRLLGETWILAIGKDPLFCMDHISPDQLGL